jgi:hypothetical protein
MYEWLTLSAEDDRQHFPQLSAAQIAHSPDTSLDIAAAQPMDVDVAEPTTTTSKRPRAPTSSAPVQESSKRPKATTSEEMISISSPPPLPPTPSQKTATSKFPSANPSQAVADRDNKMGPVGISRSAVASQKLRAETKAGTHKINKV